MTDSNSQRESLFDRPEEYFRAILVLEVNIQYDTNIIYAYNELESLK
jgi:hypothetical protein